MLPPRKFLRCQILPVYALDFARRASVCKEKNALRVLSESSEDKEESVYLRFCLSEEVWASGDGNLGCERSVSDKGLK